MPDLRKPSELYTFVGPEGKPKLTISAKRVNWTQGHCLLFSALATKPSKKSSTERTNVHKTVVYNLPVQAGYFQHCRKTDFRGQAFCKIIPDKIHATKIRRVYELSGIKLGVKPIHPGVKLL